MPINAPRSSSQLAERGIDFQQVAAQAGKPDADPFDLLCHLAFNAPLLTRRQRADRVKRQQAAFFTYFAPEAREILSDLLEKYAAEGELQFTLPDVLKVPPISGMGMWLKLSANSAGRPTPHRCESTADAAVCRLTKREVM